MAKVGSSAKFCVVVFKASLLWYWGSLAKEASSAKFGVAVFKASILNFLGVPLAKVGSSAKFCVVVFKASLLWYQGGSIGQRRFICQVLCSGMQVISALVLGTSHLPSCMSLAKVGSSAKFCVVVYKSSLLWYWGVHWPKKVHLPSFV